MLALGKGSKAYQAAVSRVAQYYNSQAAVMVQKQRLLDLGLSAPAIEKWAALQLNKRPPSQDM